MWWVKAYTRDKTTAAKWNQHVDHLDHLGVITCEKEDWDCLGKLLRIKQGHSGKADPYYEY